MSKNIFSGGGKLLKVVTKRLNNALKMFYVNDIDTRKTSFDIILMTLLVTL